MGCIRHFTSFFIDTRHNFHVLLVLKWSGLVAVEGGHVFEFGSIFGPCLSLNIFKYRNSPVCSFSRKSKPLHCQVRLSLEQKIENRKTHSFATSVFL